MNIKLNRSLAGILFALAMLCLISTIVLAAEFDFAGVWKGEYSAAAPAAAPATAGGGRGGPGGGASSSPQKITMRVKVNKDKVTGNFTMGSIGPDDIRESKIDGSKLSFKTGLAPAPIYDYEAVLVGDVLSVTQTPEGSKGGRPRVFSLMRSK